jgi:hypothetical protein
LTGRKRKRDDEDSDDSYAEGNEKNESSSVSASEEEDVSASEESSVSERPKKKRKFGKFQAKKKEYEIPKKTFDSLPEAQRDYLESLSIEQMKKKLGLNDQVKTKTKKQLMYAIADCLQNGCMPRCPKCFGGRVKRSAKGLYYCPGSFDDDEFVSCSFEAKKVDRPAWKSEPGCAL